MKIIQHSPSCSSVNVTAKSSLPVVRHAIRNERVAADSRLDRMTIWMQNVESEIHFSDHCQPYTDHPPLLSEVVEDARQKFASTSVTPLPPLPLAPLSRSASQNRNHANSRLPRKALAANQIFADHGPSDQTASFSTSPHTQQGTRVVASDRPLPQLPSESLDPSAAEGALHSPQRTRRATVSTRSPEPINTQDDFDLLTGSPSKRKEKCKSHGNLVQPISPISKLEFELQKREPRSLCCTHFTNLMTNNHDAEATPAPAPRLSAVLDRSLFIAHPLSAREDAGVQSADLSDQSTKSDELTSSPFHVEPYPPRKMNSRNIPDTPNLRRLEGVYDRFLMATSGVKRLGRGYQSDNAGPVSNNPVSTVSQYKRNHRVFSSGRRRMPPPVSSADQMQSFSVDELGMMTHGATTLDDKDETKTTAALVRRALKAIMTGTSRTVSRREL
jgi:serine/threonine-protein kinase GIN4